jgi:hypothetical protein
MDREAIIKKQATYKHAWPVWWDGIDHPDVPFPKTKRVRGEYPTAEDILRLAGE